MKKIIMTYGAIAGITTIGFMILSLNLASEVESMASLEWLGYLIMIIALSMIFVGIKRYRDHELGGVIKFGTAAMLGLGITLVASVIYVVVWEVNLSFTDPALTHEPPPRAGDPRGWGDGPTTSRAHARTDMILTSLRWREAGLWRLSGGGSAMEAHLRLLHRCLGEPVAFSVQAQVRRS